MRRGAAGGGRRRGIELCKSIAIVLLLLSLVLLALTAVQYSGSADLSGLDALAARIFGQETPPPRKDEEPAVTDAAQPLAVTVRGGGGRASFHGDFTVLDGAFETLGSHLAAALDTAGEAEAISSASLTAAAAGNSIAFLYPGDVPLQVLAGWLDADAGALEISGSTFVLTVRNGTVELLTGGADGCWRLQTEANAAALADALDDYPADGTLLAAESDDYARLDGLTLIDPSVTALTAADAVNPREDAFLTALATALGFNPYGDTTFQDRSGTVYTETDCTLQIDADCVLYLRNQGLAERFSAKSASDGDRVEYVRTLLETLTAGLDSDARLYCTGVREEDGRTAITFGYYLAGRAVRQPAGDAVEAVFQGAVLSELTFRIRAYTLRTSETVALLPALQMAAAVPEGTLLEAGYADTGDAALDAGWLRRSPGA